MESIISGSGASITNLDDNEDGFNAEDKELDVIDTDEINELSEMKPKNNMNEHDLNENDENEEGKKKTPVWRKPQKKKPTKKQDRNAGKQKQKTKQKPKVAETSSAQGDSGPSAQVKTNFNLITRC